MSDNIKGKNQNTIKRRKKRGPAIFDKEMRIKLGATFGIVIILLVFLIGIIIYKSNVNGDDYARNVLEQQNYSSKVIPYKRGDIVDRNGVLLATSIKVYNLILDPKIILSDDKKYYDDTLDALVECFNYDKSNLESVIEKYSTRSYYVHEKKLSYENIKQFLEYMDDDDKNIQGVWFETEYERKYPFSSLACNVLGFTSAGNVGTWGIEQQYNNYLNGKDGREYGYVNNDNIMEQVKKNPENGNTVVSTIDFNIQSIVEKNIKEFNKEYSPDNMGVIVMNPNNGEVLAMAGKLTYDLNNPRDLSAYYSEEELSKMTSEDKLKALNVIWRNYCISDTYEPGSTAKPFTIASALDENVIAEDDVFECNGYEVVGGWRIKCHKHSGHGIININQAIALSCNDAMMNIAAKEGAKIFSSYQKVFNFGSKTKIDLPGEESCEKLIYKAEDMKPADLATNSFGQNFNVTMIQMASAFSALVNGGYYYTPHVVKEIVNENGGVIMSANDRISKQTITKNTADIITAGLKTCVDSGTGKSAAMPGYNVGGKTGTAEKYPRGNNEYVISFIGYVGVEKPEYVCYVVIDNPKMEKVSTTYASKLFKAIMYDVVSYESLFPEDEDKEEESTSKVEQPTTGNNESTEQSTSGGSIQEEETTTAIEDDGEIFEEGIFEDTGTEEGGVTEPSGDEIN